MKSAQGVGLGWSSGVRWRSIGWTTARAASAATTGVSSGRVRPLVGARVAGGGDLLQTLEVVVQPSAWAAACSSVRPSCTSVTSEPPSAGSTVTVTVEASERQVVLPSQPHPNTRRRPGSTSRKVPAATWPGVTVQR